MNLDEVFMHSTTKTDTGYAWSVTKHEYGAPATTMKTGTESTRQKAVTAAKKHKMLLKKTHAVQETTLDPIKKMLMESMQYFKESADFMASIPHKKTSNNVETIYEHKPEHDEEVHNHLKSQGFKQAGASDATSGKTITTYKNPVSGMVAEHHKTNKSSRVILTKL